MEPPAPPLPHHKSSSAQSPHAPAVKLSSFPAKIRLLCSYGGHIVPRPHDKSLCYVGGETRVVVIDRRNPSLSSLLSHLSKTLHQPLPFFLKYQLPNEDLDSLISLSSDDDLENLLDEYDRLNGPLNSSAKPARIRLFLFFNKIEGSRSVGLPVKASEDWFLNALNSPGISVGISRGFSDSARVDCLLELNEEAEDVEDEDGGKDYVDVRVGDAGDSGPGNGGTVPNLVIGGGADKGEKNSRSQSQQDVHSVPDSPMLETTSSFGSTSSSSSVANFVVRVEETSGMEQQKLLGIEEQFGQMIPLSAAAPNIVGGAVATMGVGVMRVAEQGGRVVSDDERADRGGVDGARKALGPSPILVHQRNVATLQIEQNLGGNGGAARGNGIELASPDSVSSDNSYTNSGPRQKPTMYYDQVVQVPSGVGQVPAKPIDPNLIVSDTASRVQPQQHITDARYIFQPQHAQQPQLLPQQFVPATSQYIPQHLANSVPVTAYYTVYPSQHHQLHTHQLDQQFPVYYMPISQMQPYSLAAKQEPGASESVNTIASTHLQMTAQNPALIQQSAAYTPSTCASVSTKAEVAGGVYLTGAASNTALVQVPSGQLQSPYVGFSHLHHPPQSIAQASGAPPTYGYEFQNPAPAQAYYTQSLAPVASHYQIMPPGTGNAVLLPKALDQLPNDVAKQQLRASQAL